MLFIPSIAFVVVKSPSTSSGNSLRIKYDLATTFPSNGNFRNVAFVNFNIKNRHGGIVTHILYASHSQIGLSVNPYQLFACSVNLHRRDVVAQ